MAYLLTPGVSGSAGGVVTLLHGPTPLLYTIVPSKPLKWRPVQFKVASLCNALLNVCSLCFYLSLIWGQRGATRSHAQTCTLALQ